MGLIIRPPRFLKGISKPRLQEPAKHDAGGSKRWALQPGIVGDAVFSNDGCYRHILKRTRTCRGEGYILWIGHNPSVGEGNVDDPTIRREMGFTWREAKHSMVKCNLMDYRATHPSDLLNDRYRNNVPPFSVNNFATIAAFAKEADLIVMAYGALNPRWMPIAHRVLDEVDKYHDKTVCLGLTKDGFPRHPLYVSGNTEFIKFDGS
jgi:hypothetical protein